jgi:hypothetical protein
MATYNGNAVVVNVGGLVELLLEVGVLAVRTRIDDMLVGCQVEKGIVTKKAHMCAIEVPQKHLFGGKKG